MGANNRVWGDDEFWMDVVVALIGGIFVAASVLGAYLLYRHQRRNELSDAALARAHQSRSRVVSQMEPAVGATFKNALALAGAVSARHVANIERHAQAMWKHMDDWQRLVPAAFEDAELRGRLMAAHRDATAYVRVAGSGRSLASQALTDAIDQASDQLGEMLFDLLGALRAWELGEPIPQALASERPGMQAVHSANEEILREAAERASQSAPNTR